MKLAAFLLVCVVMVGCKDGYSEKMIYVKGRVPAKFNSEKSEFLEFYYNGERYTLYWYCKFIYHPPILVPGKEYDFILYHKKNQKLYGNNGGWYDICEIRDGETILFDDLTCEIHKIKLLSKKIDTSQFPDHISFRDDSEDRRKYYPRSYKAMHLTKIEKPGLGPIIEIRYCEKCDEAYKNRRTSRGRQPAH